jgi:hypothetical protein
VANVFDPPGRDLGDASAGPRASVNGSPLSQRMVLGQAVLAEELHEGAADAVALGGGKRDAGEQESSGGVHHRERVAGDAVAGFELAFEVDAPDVVGQAALREGPGPRVEAIAARPRRDEPVALEDLAAGARRGPARAAPLQLEQLEEFARTPVRELVAAGEDLAHDLSRRRGRTLVRAPGELLQRGGAEPRREAFDPLVAGLPADPERATERRHAHRAAPFLQYELQPLIQRTGLFPGHPPSYLSAMSPVSVLSAMSPGLDLA